MGKIDLKIVNKMLEDVEFENEKGFSRNTKPLTEIEIKQLEEMKAYLDYESLLEEKTMITFEIEEKREILNTIDNNIEEYQGGLSNYRATTLNTLYHITVRALDFSIGFITAGLVLTGFNIFKVPKVSLYLGILCILYTIIGIFEASRYRETLRKEKM